jgi:hypothetical protein
MSKTSKVGEVEMRQKFEMQEKMQSNCDVTKGLQQGCSGGSKLSQNGIRMMVMVMLMVTGDGDAYIT